jgi:hypothetical protein
MKLNMFSFRLAVTMLSISLVGVCALLGSRYSQGSSNKSSMNDAEVAAIASAMQAERTSRTTFHLSVTVTSHAGTVVRQVAGIPAGSESWTQQGKWQWSNNSGKFTEFLPGSVHDYTVSGNDVHYEDVKPDDPNYIFDESHWNTSDFFVNGLYKHGIFIDPRYYGFYTSETPIDQILSTAQFCEDLGVETLFGEECRKIKCIFAHGVTTLWIDTQHDYIARKIEISVFKNDAPFLVNTQEIESVQPLQGKWWPTHATLRHWYGVGDLQAEQTSVLAPLAP